ncbi:transposable element tc3 transposase [Caerostris extrusa]|uniref:Transposable element tc3 transposase n=1 Tax=Caerostris extrusa TaxID=172846 RepID=A0AAV4W6P1_CAEEX|nr:transposable element tc3 transposase [Caerostris extrusa]
MRDSKGPITSSALKKMMKKFGATDSLALCQRSGRPSTAAAVATTVEQTAQSMSAAAAHGECSAREVSRQTGVSYGCVWKALRITLKRYPYKLQHKQELKPPDFDSRRDLNVLTDGKLVLMSPGAKNANSFSQKVFTKGEINCKFTNYFQQF